jgi:hypothetical protein
VTWNGLKNVPKKSSNIEPDFYVEDDIVKAKLTATVWGEIYNVYIYFNENDK